MFKILLIEEPAETLEHSMQLLINCEDGIMTELCSEVDFGEPILDHVFARTQPHYRG